MMVDRPLMLPPIKGMPTATTCGGAAVAQRDASGRGRGRGRGRTNGGGRTSDIWAPMLIRFV